MKRIAFLGASLSQTPILHEAKGRGVYCITIDNLPDNPGHVLGDLYLNVSTVDREAVYQAVRSLQIDGIISYASDIATTTAAYVASQLRLKSNSLASIDKLTDKSLFRQALKEIDLNTPWCIAGSMDTLLLRARQELINEEKEVIVKPTDSAGTKGVSLSKTDVVSLTEALNNANAYSNNGKLIIEEFIGNSEGDVHGDGFVLDGKLVFLYLGDHMYDLRINALNPTGTTWPSLLPESKIKQVYEAVQKIINHVGFEQGSINVEARYDDEGQLYIMEVGPRNGGYFVPLAIELSIGTDLVAATMDLLLGQEPQLTNELEEVVPVAYYAVHARTKGKLVAVDYSEWLEDRIVIEQIVKKDGERVEIFTNSSHVIAILLIKFASQEEMVEFSNNVDTHINVVVESDI